MLISGQFCEYNLHYRPSVALSLINLSNIKLPTKMSDQQIFTKQKKKILIFQKPVKNWTNLSEKQKSLIILFEIHHFMQISSDKKKQTNTRIDEDDNQKMPIPPKKKKKKKSGQQAHNNIINVMIALNIH